MSIRFAYYFPAQKPLFLDIEIPSDVWISTLLKAIEMEFDRKGVKAGDLHLFKTDIPMKPKISLQSRVLQWLHEQPADSQLDAMDPVQLFFPDGPHPISHLKLDIIIADAEVLEMVDTLSDPYGAYNKKLKKVLNKCIDTHLTLPSPSEVVEDAGQLKKVFGGAEHCIHVGRLGGAPAVIFHPVLAALQQNLDHLEEIEVSPVEISRASRYLYSAVKFYKDEDQREIGIEELITDAFGGTGKWKHSVDLEPSNSIKGKGKQMIPYASWWHDVFLILVFELKNSLGLYGDALFQAIVDYSKMVAEDNYKPFRQYSNFPAVLIGATANRLEIAVAVSVGSIYVTKLLTLDLSLGFHTSDNIICLARVFNALSRCRKGLETYYGSVINSRPSTLSCLFPNPMLIDRSKALPQLTYRQFLSRAGQPTSDLVDLGDATTAMYIAILDGHEVIVKFTARYNEAAHRLLADAELAPRLHFCGRIVGNLYMIVMDRVDGTSVWQLRRDNKPIPQIVSTNVEEAVRLLHKRDIVFGDLRTNNVLYIPSGSEGRAVLVDFDWPAKDGEGIYPATLNPATTWHNEVVPYSIMRKTHDLWQLDRLKGLCTGSDARPTVSPSHAD